MSRESGDIARPILSRADLLRARRTLGRAGLAQVADALGYEFRQQVSTSAPDRTPPSPEPAAPPPLASASTRRLVPTPFLVCTSCTDTPPRVWAHTASHMRAPPLRPTARPPWPALQTWSSLAPRLLALLSHELPSRTPDIPRVVDRLASLEPLGTVPLVPLRRVRSALTVIVDRDPRLAPIWPDQRELIDRLREQLRPACLEVIVRSPGDSVLDLASSHSSTLRAGDVLVLSDLGIQPVGAAPPLETTQRESSDIAQRRAWKELGWRVHAAGGRPMALVPWRFGEVPPWRIETFDGAPAPDWDEVAQAARRLLALCSPLSRMDRGLLRDLRRTLGLPGGVAVEFAVQAAPEVSERAAECVEIRPQERDALLAEFRATTPHERQTLLDCLRRWRSWLPLEIWYRDLLVLAALGCSEHIAAEELDAARRFFAELVPEKVAGSIDEVADPRLKAIARWIDEEKQRSGGLGWNADSALGSLGMVWYGVLGNTPHAQPPRGISPIGPQRGTGEPIEADVFQVAGEIRLRPVRSEGSGLGPPSGSPLGRIRLVEPVAIMESCAAKGGHKLTPEAGWTAALPALAPPSVSMAPAIIVRTDCGELTLSVMRREPWQRSLSRDRHGLRCTTVVSGVEFAMRWIPPGRFRMGTPVSEQELALASVKPHLDEETFKAWQEWVAREGPRHEVMITRGFWLGEVPVTQRLWTAVMGKNPSRFQSDDRPVEQVSWHEARAFIAKANEEAEEDGGGLDLRLPLECEWEYACRAGTEAATYAGELEYRGANDAPLLEEIAWYGGNSAAGYELADGVDNSGWPGRSGPAGMVGTHPVGRKAPNTWGLRDMLGNVWEWVEDGVREYVEASAVDPKGPVLGDPSGDGPVGCRGGAWGSDAASVRAGGRIAGSPGRRSNFLGFRLARGLGAGGPVPGQDRAEPGSAGRAAAGGGAPQQDQRGPDQ